MLSASSASGVAKPRTMLAVAGRAFGVETPVLLDSCAEVSLLGRQFIKELDRHKIDFRKSLRRPTTTVVGALSGAALKVLGELNVPLTLTGVHASGVERKVGTTVKFTVTESYDGPLLVAWSLMQDWEANIQARATGDSVTFNRWPDMVMSDIKVPGAAWAEVSRVAARIVTEEVKSSPFEKKSSLRPSDRAMILRHDLFADAKSIGIEEVTNNHMTRLKELLRRGSPD